MLMMFPCWKNYETHWISLKATFEICLFLTMSTCRFWQVLLRTKMIDLHQPIFKIFKHVLQQITEGELKKKEIREGNPKKGRK